MEEQIQVGSAMWRYFQFGRSSILCGLGGGGSLKAISDKIWAGTEAWNRDCWWARREKCPLSLNGIS